MGLPVSSEFKQTTNTPLSAREEAATQEVQNVEADIYEDPTAPMNGDGNTVNTEREQTEIAKNTLGYETAIQLLNKKICAAKICLSRRS
jgi:flagellar basal-body rod protein FlgB